jgi:hypothetical protein
MVLDIVDRSGITHHLLSAAGKDSNLYLLDRDNLGKFHISSNQIYQELAGVFSGGVWSSPAYFNGSIYQGGGPEGGTGPLLQLQFDFTNLTKPLLKSTPASSTQTQFGYPGPTPTISSNGTTNGIVWAYEQNNGQAVLHATTQPISKPSSLIRVALAAPLNLLSRRYATEKYLSVRPARSQLSV